MKKMFNPSINRKMKSVQPKLLGYYTVKEAADVLGVSVTTLRQRQFRSDSAYRWNKDETLFLLLDTSHKRVNDYDYYEINAFNQFSKTYNERPKVQAARARGMRVPSYGGTQKLLVINSQKDLDKYYRSLQTQLRLDGHVNVHI